MNCQLLRCSSEPYDLALVISISTRCIDKCHHCISADQRCIQFTQFVLISIFDYLDRFQYTGTIAYIDKHFRNEWLYMNLGSIKHSPISMWFYFSKSLSLIGISRGENPIIISFHERMSEPWLSLSNSFSFSFESHLHSRNNSSIILFLWECAMHLCVYDFWRIMGMPITPNNVAAMNKNVTVVQDVMSNYIPTLLLERAANSCKRPTRQGFEITSEGMGYLWQEYFIWHLFYLEDRRTYSKILEKVWSREYIAHRLGHRFNRNRPRITDSWAFPETPQWSLLYILVFIEFISNFRWLLEFLPGMRSNKLILYNISLSANKPLVGRSDSLDGRVDHSRCNLIKSFSCRNKRVENGIQHFQ